MSSSSLNSPPQPPQITEPLPNPPEPSLKTLKKSPKSRPILTEIDSSIHQNSQNESYKQKENLIKGFGPSQYHSSATFQNSILSISIPKAQRFTKNPILSDPMNSNNSVSTLSQRATMIGYGNKACYPSYTLKMAKDNPAPNFYLMKSDFENKNKGKSFGISYQAYARVKLPHIDIITTEEASLIPGPGYYNIVGDMFGKNKTKALILGKGKTENDLIKEKAPPPNYYSPKDDLMNNNRYKFITFGASKRSTFQENLKRTPGPGSYNMKSKFDEIVEKNKFFKGFRLDTIA